MKLFYHIYS